LSRQSGELVLWRACTSTGGLEARRPGQPGCL